MNPMIKHYGEGPYGKQCASCEAFRLLRCLNRNWSKKHRPEFSACKLYKSKVKEGTA